MQTIAERDVTVPLRSRRFKRVQLVQRIQHAIPAFGLLLGGAESLRAGAHGFELALAAAGIVTSGLLIGSIIRSVRAAREGHASRDRGHGIDWADIWAAGVLFAEAGETWRLRHHIARPVILSGVSTLVLGLLHSRIAAARERRRVLSLTDDRLVLAGRPFRRFTARWDEIAQIHIADGEAVIHTHHGRRRRIDLSDLENAADVREVLEIAQKRLAP